MIYPGAAIMIFVLGGLGSAATFTAYNAAQELGPELSGKDFMPAPPPYPPLPRFVFSKQEQIRDALRLKHFAPPSDVEWQ